MRDTTLIGIEKALRRALDSLNQPAIVAAGFLDAWYAWREWEVGFRLIVQGPKRSSLFDALPRGNTQIEEVADIDASLAELLEQAQEAKRATPFVEPLNAKRRGEYYRWLTDLNSGARLIRYGCDRYFNPLRKPERPVRHKVKKGHPPPHWLVHYQYDTHDLHCTCRICTNRS